MQTFSHKLIPEDISTHRIPQNTFSLEIEMNKPQILEIYAEMAKMFIFENYAQKNYNKMRGFLHLTTGQESIYGGLFYIFKKYNSFDEYLMITSYRCHSLCYLSGSSFFEIACELLGRKSGVSKGKGGSMHLYNERFFGGHGIVGAQVSLGTGLAFGLKYCFENQIFEVLRSENLKNSQLPRKIKLTNENNNNKEKKESNVKKENNNNKEKNDEKKESNKEKEENDNKKENKECNLSDVNNDENRLSSLNSEENNISNVNNLSDRNNSSKIRNDFAGETDFLLKMSNKKAVFVFLGDGATNQGQVYESFNLALVHKLPIIYIIENNKLSMWTETKKVSDTDNYYKRWNMMPGIRIHSDNIFVVSCILEQIILKNEFPVVVQIDTHRVCKHSARDETHFDIGKLREVVKNTRLDELEAFLINGGCKDEVDFLWRNIDKEISECWEKALNDGFPDDTELMTDIYD